MGPPVHQAALQMSSAEPVVLCHFRMNVEISSYTVECTTLICQGPEVASENDVIFVFLFTLCDHEDRRKKALH